MKRAFSLIELLIVIAILGILAAVVVPQVQSYSQEAKEAAAKEMLRILRQTIARYAGAHNGVAPGYPNDDPTKSPSANLFSTQLCKNAAYLRTIPENPFNGSSAVSVAGNATKISAIPIGGFGWIYKPATKEIRLATPGSDSQDVLYSDY